MEHDAWFFIGVFAFIFLMWIATGGPTHPISFTGPTLAQPGALGGGTYLSLPRAPFSIGGADVSLPGSSGGGSVPGESGTPAPSLVGGSAFGTPSPYRNMISLNHSISGVGSPNPENEYIQMTIASNAGVPVNLTGWTLWSEATGASAVIPKGTEIPMSGVINAAQDIVLTPGTRALLISGRSPIGASFRENKCIGYFSSFQRFSPSLPQNCPLPSSELAAFYGGELARDTACTEHVKKLSRCQVAISPPVNLSGSCQNFLVKYLHYNGCVETHKNDRDFLGGTWRVYLGRTSALWRPRHDIVKLLDASGKTVDAFSY